MSDEQTPPTDESALIAERRAKLDRLRERGAEPFPHDFPGREPIDRVRAAHEGLADGEETDAHHRVAGRVTARRGHGKAAFVDIRDGTGRIQLHSRADVLGRRRTRTSSPRSTSATSSGSTASPSVPAAASSPSRSNRGRRWPRACARFRTSTPGSATSRRGCRHRELDLIANPEVLERFRTRGRTIAEIRAWLDSHDFVEVETPVLQPLYGGALARPFTTHHNALDRDLYLRIATELYLKRCVVGGIDRVYELGKDFRNEGISPKHNPEFTMLEWYEAYADYNDAATRLEQLVSSVAERVLGTNRVERDGVVIDLDPPWERITMRDALLDKAGVDLAAEPSREDLARAAGVELSDELGWGKLVDMLLSRDVEPGLIQPTFILDYPVELSPFAKRHRSTPGVVERWEAFVGGIEIANAFSELNDPDEQRRRFEQQAEELRRGDAEAQPHDEDFLRALELGMPPTAGVGLGIDRLVMMLTGAPSVREVLLFPAMR